MSGEDVPALVRALEQDAGSRFPRFPSQALLALRDDGVRAAVQARFEDGQSVGDVRSLPYHASSGLLFVVLTFHPAPMLSEGRHDLLVLLQGSGEVVGVIDPFDSRQPNGATSSPPAPPPPAAAEPPGALPFALARPSATETVRFRPEELAPGQERTAAYLSRMGLGAGPGGGGAGGLGGGVFGGDGSTRTQIGTQTVFTHGGWTPGPFSWVEYDEKIDETTDDYIV